MKNAVKAKEPWLGVFLNMIFPGLGEFYAKRKVRALVILGISVILSCLAIFGIHILANPESAITKLLLIIGIAFVVFEAVFNLFVIIDGFLCVRNYNVSAGIKPSNSAVRMLSIIGCIILFLACGIQAAVGNYLRNNIMQAFKIPTGTMQPTLMVGDRIIVNKRAFVNTTPQRWDIIVFNYPEDRKKSFIKRVVGLPGETLEIKEGSIIINGERVETKIHYYNMGEYGKEGHKIEIPQNDYFVLGDNSATSKDSRYFGFVPEKDIIGRAIKIYWPLERVGKVE